MDLTDTQIRGQARYYGIPTDNPDGTPIDPGRLLEQIQERQAVISSMAPPASGNQGRPMAKGPVRNKPSTTAGSIVLPKPLAPPVVNAPVMQPKPKPAANRGRPATRSRAPVTLPLESDLGTLSGIRTFVSNTFYGNPNAPLINPQASFAHNPILPPSNKPLPPARGRPVAKGAGTAKAKAAGEPAQVLTIAVPAGRPGPAKIPIPKVPINIPPPSVVRPSQEVSEVSKKNIPEGITQGRPTLSVIPASEPKPEQVSRESPQVSSVPRLVLRPPNRDSRVLPSGTQEEFGIPDRVTIPLTPTKLEAIPLPEPQEAEVQLQVAQTSKQRAVFNIGTIDQSRLTAGRALRGDNTAYTFTEMKNIARDLGLNVSGGKAELYKKIMDELRNRGQIQERNPDDDL